MSFVLPFKKLSGKSVKIAGGKGAQLGEMLNAGIPVPNGFVVLTDSFDLFLKENSLDKKIGAELKKANPKKTASVDNASKNIRSLIAKGKTPKEVETAVLKEFFSLKAEYVAVRSSATAEDAADASWAGELESYTNVTKSGLLDAVKKCWSSLFTPRAIFYRIEKKLSKKAVGVAVVVQKMVNSGVAGVAFTVNPITENKNEMVIEAGLGLGESVVAGKITPDKYVVNKEEGFIENIEVNAQEKMLSRIKGKTKEVSVPKNIRETQKLTGRQIMELAEVCRKIENHYKFPQDIEFALEKAKIFIVQTRPITTLKKA